MGYVLCVFLNSACTTDRVLSNSISFTLLVPCVARFLHYGWRPVLEVFQCQALPVACIIHAACYSSSRFRRLYSTGPPLCQPPLCGGPRRLVLSARSLFIIILRQDSLEIHPLGEWGRGEGDGGGRRRGSLGAAPYKSLASSADRFHCRPPGAPILYLLLPIPPLT